MRSYSAPSASGSSTSNPYQPLKSIVSTAPVAATSSTSARRPGRHRVELEAHAGGAGQPPPQRLDRRLLAQAQRVDEAHRPRLPAEHLVQRAAGLAQREVERRRLERPPAKAQRRLPLGRRGPQLERREVLAEARQRPFPLERQRRPGLVQRGAVLAEHGHVLAQPLGAGADQPHVRRDAVELVGEHGVQALVLARLDHERQPRDPRPQRLAPHRAAPAAVGYRGRPTGR